MNMQDIDRVTELIAAVKRNYKDLSGMRCSKQMRETLDTLWENTQALIQTLGEALQERAEQEQDAQMLADLRRSRLMGMSEEFVPFARKRPEQSCGSFKAQQVNQVLQPLKEELEERLGLTLSLVPEDGSLTYSDVCVLLRAYQDVSASYVHKHYNGNPPVLTPFPVDLKMRDIQDEILMYCTDEPRSVLQIAEMLGYKDKKTVRKYLNPLLDAGLLARTLPDRPNSRNQKYITARPC